jgi:hypothetical protein
MKLKGNASFTMRDFNSVPRGWRERIPAYINGYFPLNQFM